ncbi:hypothetical protein TGRH88_026930 [Toxoplasma gondii]|uniref:Uncharacterized protein n=1 Tax=Toxoplasma gondii TaxID=5811 RepID=A0A7J6KA22_TOXGO|nr:hypothetical protein TGRH88_026930 [Toxoplasma gondii]
MQRPIPGRLAPKIAQRKATKRRNRTRKTVQALQRRLASRASAKKADFFQTRAPTAFAEASKAPRYIFPQSLHF